MHRFLALALASAPLASPAEADLENSEAAVDLDVPFSRTGVGAGKQTRGYTFSLDEARTLTHLGLFSYNGTDGADVDRQVGVWDSAGNMVAEVTVPVGGGEIDDRGDGDKFIYRELAAPVILFPGETYTAGVWYSVNNSPGLCFNATFSTIDGFNYLQTIESIAVPAGEDGAFTMPTIIREDRLNGYVGPNLRFDLDPPQLGFGSELRITDLDLEGTIVTLTWNSSPSKTYAVKWSLDLESFPGDLNDSVTPDDGDSTTRSFDISDASLHLQQRWFLRIEEVPSG